MFLVFNKKNRDLLFCFLILVSSTLVSVYALAKIQSDKTIIKINVPFSAEPQTNYGIYYQEKCVGYLNINKILSLDLAINSTGQLRILFGDSLDLLDISLNVIINSMGQVAYSKLNIKNKENKTLSFSTMNVNPIETIVSYPTAIPPFQSSFEGPVLFSKASNKFYTLTIPVPSSPNNNQQLQSIFKDQLAPLFAGFKIIELSELPSDCSNKDGASLEVGQFLKEIVNKIVPNQ